MPAIFKWVNLSDWSMWQFVILWHIRDIFVILWHICDTIQHDTATLRSWWDSVTPSGKLHFLSLCQTIKWQGPLLLQECSWYLDARFNMSITLFHTLTKVFRRITLTMHLLVQSPPQRCARIIPGPHTELIRGRSRVRDLTGQLCNISQYPTACGGYSDVWKCDWIKDATVVKVTQ